MSDGLVAKQGRISSAFHFLAGLSSGVTSAFLLQPADLLKTRVQQSQTSSLSLAVREILNGPHPVRSLWRGTTPSVLRTGTGSALYFGMLNQLRTYVSQQNGGRTSTGGSVSALPRLSNSANLVTGAFARAAAGLVLSPVTVLKVRYESSLYAYSSLLGAARDTLAKEGLRGFFAGFGATAARDAPYAGLYVLFYEQAKVRLAAVDGKVATPVVNFASGSVAAVAATALTNPFDAVKTRIQLMPAKYRNMMTAARIMMAEEGWRSMFDGLGLRMLRKGLSSALAWTVYEELIRQAEARIV